MTCAEQQRRLSAYIDAQLPPAEREALDVHLAACAGCREALTTLQTMLQSLKTLAVGQAPDVWPAVRAQLKAAPQAAPRATAQPVRAPSAWHLNWPVHGAALMMGAVLLAVVLDVPERARPARRARTVALHAQPPAMSKTRVLAAARVQKAEAPRTVAGVSAVMADGASPSSAPAPMLLAQQMASVESDMAASSPAEAEVSAGARTMRVSEADAEQRGMAAELKAAAPPPLLLLLWIALAPDETIIEAVSAWLPLVNGRVVSTVPYLTVELPAGQYGALREELSRVGQYYDDEIPEVHVHTDLRSTPPPNVPPETLVTVEIHLLAAE